MEKASALPPFFSFNAALASCLHIVDVGLNSSLEYGDLPGQDPLDGNNNAILAFVQVLLQITAVVNLLVLLGATFLFRSGLFGLLYAQFRLVLLAQLCYIGLTIVLGVARANLLSTGVALTDIWGARGYTVLSCIHKLGALFCYSCSIYAVEQLRHPKFYSHAYWMRR